MQWFLVNNLISDETKKNSHQKVAKFKPPFDERYYTTGEAQILIKQKWLCPKSDQMTNLVSAVLIFILLCDNKLSVVDKKPAQVRNFGILAFLRSSTTFITLCDVWQRILPGERMEPTQVQR